MLAGDILHIITEGLAQHGETFDEMLSRFKDEEARIQEGQRAFLLSLGYQEAP